MGSRIISRRVASLRPLVFLATTCVLLSAGARTAAAGACGDDVDGARVPCACGDFVVSDTTLWPTDPVATEPCPDDGLTVIASKEAERITLHLGGQSIVGRGYGTGIRIVRGGRLGAIVVGGDEGDARAEVARFDTGIRASGRDVLSAVRSIDVHDNASDGLNLHTSGTTVEDVRTERNGRDGAAVGGHGNALAGVSALDNSRDGVKVRGSAATLDADTSGNGRNGADLGGRGHRVEQLHASDNGGAGVAATGTGHDVRATRATGNPRGSVVGPAGATR